jgi:limonene 1,2-monooxygenase
MHIAETREKARENVRFGLEKWLYYFQEVAALPLAPADGGDPVDSLIESGLAVIGTPDDAIAQIERLEKQSGGFGAFLQMGHNWADFNETKRSYELMARFVFPRFQGSNVNRTASLEWARDNREVFMGEARMAVGARVAQHIQEKGAGEIAPEILEAMGLKKD